MGRQKDSRVRQSTMNMTEGGALKLLVVFSIPMLIGNIFQQVYNLVDSIIVGQFVGANALAAIGATGSGLNRAELWCKKT